MFIVQFYSIWSLNFLFLFFYFSFVISFVFYLLFSLQNFNSLIKSKNISNFFFISGSDIFLLFSSFLFFFIVINFSWTSYTITIWFNHLIFTSFQNKIFYLIFFFFYSILFVYSTVFFFSNKEIFDFLITIFNLFIWIFFFFFSNTIFTVIFFVEILSTLIFLLIISSFFSSTYFYNNLNFSLINYFSSNSPFYLIQSLMYYFWISLISSINLFLSLIFFYLKFFSFDFFFFEYLFIFLISMAEVKQVFFFLILWFNLVFCFFLKCGLTPFYFWKPAFFRGLSLHFLIFYISFFYFFLFLFILNFFLFYFNEIFFFFININLFLFFLSFLIFLSILWESFYLKSFLAISSVINSLFIFLALNGNFFIDFFFF